MGKFNPSLKGLSTCFSSFNPTHLLKASASRSLCCLLRNGLIFKRQKIDLCGFLFYLASRSHLTLYFKLSNALKQILKYYFLLFKLFSVGRLVWISLSGFPGGSDGKETAFNVGHAGSIPELGTFPGEGEGNPLQYFCLGNPMEKESGGLQSTGLQRVGHYWTTNTYI